MRFVDPGAIGECEARTQEVSRAVLLALPRTQNRAAERGRATQRLFCESLSAIRFFGFT